MLPQNQIKNTPIKKLELKTLATKAPTFKEARSIEGANEEKLHLFKIWTSWT